MQVIKMTGDANATYEAAKDVLHATKELPGFVFAYIDPNENRVISFSRDSDPAATLASGQERLVAVKDIFDVDISTIGKTEKFPGEPGLLSFEQVYEMLFSRLVTKFGPYEQPQIHIDGQRTIVVNQCYYFMEESIEAAIYDEKTDRLFMPDAQGFEYIFEFEY
jgi:hypothetical protein